MEYVITELDKLRQTYPNFAQASEKLKKDTVDRAKEVWSGYNYGGMFPQGKQFGVTTLLPKFMLGSGTASFRQEFTSTGWQDIFNRTMDEDVIVGGMGFAIPDPSVNITELRMEIEDTKYPRVNIEELQCYKQPAVVFKQGWRCEEEQSFLLKGNVESTGYQRVVPINSFALVKKKELVISE